MEEQLLPVLQKAETVLNRLYEVLNGDEESCSIKYMRERTVALDKKMDHVMTSLAELDDKHSQLEKRTAEFAAQVNAKIRETKALVSK